MGPRYVVGCKTQPKKGGVRERADGAWPECQSPALSSRTLAEPDRCKRSAAKLPIRDPGKTVAGARAVALGPGSNTRNQLLTQLSACNGRDDPRVGSRHHFKGGTIDCFECLTGSISKYKAHSRVQLFSEHGSTMPMGGIAHCARKIRARKSFRQHHSANA